MVPQSKLLNIHFLFTLPNGIPVFLRELPFLGDASNIHFRDRANWPRANFIPLTVLVAKLVSDLGWAIEIHSGPMGEPSAGWRRRNFRRKFLLSKEEALERNCPHLFHGPCYTLLSCQSLVFISG